MLHCGFPRVERQYVLHIPSVCLLPFFMQHRKRVRNTIVWSVACPNIPYISTLPQIWHDFRENLGNVKFVFWLYAIFLKHFSL